MICPNHVFRIWIQNHEDKLFRFGRPEYNGADDDATQMRKAGMDVAEPTLKIFDSLGSTAQINNATELDWLPSQIYRPLGAQLTSHIELSFQCDTAEALWTANPTKAPHSSVTRRQTRGSRCIGIPVHITLVGTRRSTAWLHYELEMDIEMNRHTTTLKPRPIRIGTKYLGRLLRIEVKFVNLNRLEKDDSKSRIRILILDTGLETEPRCLEQHNCEEETDNCEGTGEIRITVSCCAFLQASRVVEVRRLPAQCCF